MLLFASSLLYDNIIKKIKMRIFKKYNIKKQDDGSYVVVRIRYNYPDEYRIVSENILDYKDAEERSNALNLKITKELKKGTFKIK